MLVHHCLEELLVLIFLLVNFVSQLSVVLVILVQAVMVATMGEMLCLGQSMSASNSGHV